MPLGLQRTFSKGFPKSWRTSLERGFVRDSASRQGRFSEKSPKNTAENNVVKRENKRKINETISNHIKKRPRRACAVESIRKNHQLLCKEKKPVLVENSLHPVTTTASKDTVTTRRTTKRSRAPHSPTHEGAKSTANVDQTQVPRRSNRISKQTSLAQKALEYSNSMAPKVKVTRKPRTKGPATKDEQISNKKGGKSSARLPPLANAVDRVKEKIGLTSKESKSTLSDQNKDKLSRRPNASKRPVTRQGRSKSENAPKALTPAYVTSSVQKPSRVKRRNGSRSVSNNIPATPANNGSHSKKGVTSPVAQRQVIVGAGATPPVKRVSRRRPLPLADVYDVKDDQRLGPSVSIAAKAAKVRERMRKKRLRRVAFVDSEPKDQELSGPGHEGNRSKEIRAAEEKSEKFGKRIGTPELVRGLQKGMKSKRGRNTIKFRRNARELMERVAEEKREEDSWEEEIWAGVETPRIEGTKEMDWGTPASIGGRADGAGTVKTPDGLRSGERRADKYLANIWRGKKRTNGAQKHEKSKGIQKVKLANVKRKDVVLDDDSDDERDEWDEVKDTDEEADDEMW